jgi:hypothetical protein
MYNNKKNLNIFSKIFRLYQFLKFEQFFNLNNANNFYTFANFNNFKKVNIVFKQSTVHLELNSTSLVLPIGTFFF